MIKIAPCLILLIILPAFCFSENISKVLIQTIEYLPADEINTEIDFDHAYEEYINGSFINTNGQNYFGSHKNGIWFCMEVDLQSDPGEYFLQFEYSYIEQVDLYLIRSGSLQGQWRSGTHIKEANEPANYLTPVFPLVLERGSCLLLFQVRGTEVFIPLNIQKEADFIRNITHTTATMAMIYGILICFILVNIYFLMVSARNKKKYIIFYAFSAV